MKTMFVLLVAIAMAWAAGGGELRGGFARIDITPTKPVTMAGYAARTNVSQGVHDPLSARAMALEADGKRVVIVSVDNLGWYNDTAEPTRQAILEQTKLQPSELLMAAIHTHSAPTFRWTRSSRSPTRW